MPAYIVQSTEREQDRAIMARSYREAAFKYVLEAPQEFRFAKGFLVSDGAHLKGYVVKENATSRWPVEVPLEEAQIKPTGILSVFGAEKVAAGSSKKSSKKARPKRR